MKTISNAGTLRKYAATRYLTHLQNMPVSRVIGKKRNYFHEGGKIKILAFIHIKRNKYTTWTYQRFAFKSYHWFVVCTSKSRDPELDKTRNRQMRCILNTNEPGCEKTGLRGFRPVSTRTMLCNNWIWLEARNLGFRKTIFVAKTKALISCAVTAQLVCVFVFAYMQKASFLITRLK